MTEQEARIRELESQLAERDEMISTLQNSINELNRLVTNLTEIITQMRKDKFGPSSEKTVVTDGSCEQLSLFNEVELESGSKAVEPVERDSKGKLKPKSKSVRKVQIIKDLPVTEVLCEAPDEAMTCPRCHTDLKVIGREYVREEIEYIPAQLRILRYYRYSYECPKCKRSDKPFIIKAGVPTSLMNHSPASPSSVANVMYQKYVNGIPLYRQEKDWERMGIILSRATMANWTIKCADEYITPVVDRMRELLIQRDVLHADETPVQVLKEPGKKPQTKSYMWLYRTGNDGEAPIILYDYRSSRSGDNAEEYIKGFSGYLHTDGYSGYNRLTGVTRCGCWAHLRRKFDHRSVGLISLGTCDSNLHAALESADDEGIHHVVAVADEAELQTVETTLDFADRHEVSEHLAGMGEISQTVDDRDRAVFGEILHFALLKGTDHDAVEITGQHARGVLDRFASADLEIVGREEQRLTAELVHTYFKGNAGTGGSLLEDHAEGLSLKQTVADAVLLFIFELVGQIEDVVDLTGCEIQHFQQMVHTN